MTLLKRCKYNEISKLIIIFKKITNILCRDCVIRSSKMISNFTANEIEKCIFNAFQHDSEVYFQQIYDLTIYIRKHSEYLIENKI